MPVRTSEFPGRAVCLLAAVAFMLSVSMVRPPGAFAGNPPSAGDNQYVDPLNGSGAPTPNSAGAGAGAFANHQSKPTTTTSSGSSGSGVALALVLVVLVGAGAFVIRRRVGGARRSDARS